MEYDEWLPYAYKSGTDNWVLLHIRTLGASKGTYNRDAPAGSCFTNTATGIASLFKCTTGVASGEHCYDITYYYNGQVGGYHVYPHAAGSATYAPRRLPDIDYPSELTLICDGTVTFRSGSSWLMTNQGAGPHWGLHGGGQFNTTWADGHVSSMPLYHPAHPSTGQVSRDWYGWWGWPWCKLYN